MNTSELAQLLNGRKYPFRIDKELAAQAKREGLVIVYGASDDLMEFEGAIRDEFDCYQGGTAYINNTGLLQNDCDNDGCPHYEKLKQQATTIEALWSAEGDYSWTYRTDIPHKTFEVVEDGSPYCRGIVFCLADVTALKR